MVSLGRKICDKQNKTATAKEKKAHNGEVSILQ
jgi:hypothetical protein